MVIELSVVQLYVRSGIDKQQTTGLNHNYRHAGLPNAMPYEYIL